MARAKIYTGSDHAGFELRGRVVAHLRALGFEVEDLGIALRRVDRLPGLGGRGRARGARPRRDAGRAGVRHRPRRLHRRQQDSRRARGRRLERRGGAPVARAQRRQRAVRRRASGPRSEAFAIVDAWLDTPFEGGRHARAGRRRSRRWRRGGAGGAGIKKETIGPDDGKQRPVCNETHALGQSIWYDNMRRGLLRSGALADLVARGVRGLTSNPTIFEKAIVASGDYEDALRKLVADGRSTIEIYEQLAIEDIRGACDLLLPRVRGERQRRRARLAGGAARAGVRDRQDGLRGPAPGRRGRAPQRDDQGAGDARGDPGHPRAHRARDQRQRDADLLAAAVRRGGRGVPRGPRGPRRAPAARWPASPPSPASSCRASTASATSC